MMERYEEEYSLYWKLCLNGVDAPGRQMDVVLDEEYMEKLPKEDRINWLRKVLEPHTFQAATDQRDLFMLRGDKKYIRMHPKRWLWTIDAALAEYMYLVDHSKKRQAFEPEDEILSLRQKHLKLRKKDRKELRIPIGYMVITGRGRDVKKKLWLPKYAGIARLNLLCRELSDSEKAPDKKLHICHDGRKYAKAAKEKADSSSNMQKGQKKEKTEYVNVLPQFTLSDYLYHELTTGISLSIEITAALMELDPRIRDAALEAFCNKGLSKVVQSKYIFTRIAAARNFFHQIQMDWLINSFTWDSANETLTEEDARQGVSPGMWERFEDSIARAGSHLLCLDWDAFTYYLLDSERKSFPTNWVWVFDNDDKSMLKKLKDQRADHDKALAPWIEDYNAEETEEQCIYVRPFSFGYRAVPTGDSDIEQMIQYYEGLLKMVEYPLNLTQSEQEIPGNLAVFVQWKHANVPVLMTYLKYGELRKSDVRQEYLNRGEYPVTFKENCTDITELFKKVHGKVQEASMNAFGA